MNQTHAPLRLKKAVYDILGVKKFDYEVVFDPESGRYTYHVTSRKGETTFDDIDLVYYDQVTWKELTR